MSLTPGAGKPTAMLRAEEAAVFDAQPVTIRCLFCDWTWDGCASEGRTIATTHRLHAHPDVKPARRRWNRAGFNPSWTMNEQDRAAMELERHKRARLHGVDLEE